jgi:hypothetical protein
MTLCGTTASAVPSAADLLGRAAEGQRARLGQEVGQEEVVHAVEVVIGLGEGEEVRRHQHRALVQQLVEGVLAVGARLAPDDLAGRDVDRRAVEGHRLAVGLHAQLLQVGRESGEVLRVGQHRLALRAEEVDVPDRDQAEQSREVLLVRRGAEVLVDDVEAVEHSRYCSGPIATMSESPIAEVNEYRPPTQSQKPNMFAVSMPNSATFSALVETATKCFATAFSSPPSPSTSQRRAPWRWSASPAW